MLLGQDNDYAGWGIWDNSFYRWSLDPFERQLQGNDLNSPYAIKDGSFFLISQTSEYSKMCRLAFPGS